MKNILFILLLLCPTFLFADPWDNLTLQQAEEVVAYLEKNPYIFDYCDCCDSEGEFATDILLVKVTETKIVQCEWSPTQYSIKTKVEVIAEVPYEMGEPKIDQTFSKVYTDDFILTMNYNWGFNCKTKQAGPIYTSVSYDVYGENDLTTGSCHSFINYPSYELVNNKGYKKWYKKNIKKKKRKKNCK